MHSPWLWDYRHTCDTYIRNICPNTPDSVVHKDVQKLDFDTLAPIDARAFGFPCNDYSVVDEKKGMDGAFDPLYSFGVAALQKFQPM